MRVIGTAGAPSATHERETLELVAGTDTYVDGYASITAQVPEGWTLLHVRVEAD